MVKDNVRILVTGHYWHSDFRGLIASNATSAITLYPIEKADSLDGSENYDLIVIAQARRDSIDLKMVEHIQQVYPNTPTVALLGTWCEGEMRSGVPWPGIPRVYWHQWNGQFAEFIECVNNQKEHGWQLPKTASKADQVAPVKLERFDIGNDQFQGIIGISAWTQSQYSMIADALDAFGVQTCWIERTTWDGEAIRLIKAVILDDDSMTSNLENRIRWIFSTLGRRPLVLSLGFPRADEVEQLKELGVGAVVSKPFKLGDLKQAILVATGAVVSSANAAGKNGLTDSGKSLTP